MNKKIRFPITAGLLVRRQIRRYLLAIGVEFIEEKGWIDSIFFVTADKEMSKRILSDVENWIKQHD